MRKPNFERGPGANPKLLNVKTLVQGPQIWDPLGPVLLSNLSFSKASDGLISCVKQLRLLLPSAQTSWKTLPTS